MEITPRGYVRPKKLDKREKFRRQEYPHPDQDCFSLDFTGEGYPRFLSARMPTDPRTPIAIPRDFASKVPSRLNDEDVMFQERFASMRLGPKRHDYAYPRHHGPPPGSRFMSNSRFSSGPGPLKDEKEKNKCVMIRIQDFADREVAASYISHLIRYGSESWIFKMPDEKEDTGVSEATGERSTQRQQTKEGRGCGMKNKPGPFGYVPKQGGETERESSNAVELGEADARRNNAIVM